MKPAADDSPALQAGLSLLRNNQARSAEAFFEALVARSNAAPAWRYLGVARHLLGKLPAAVEAFRHSLDQREDPDVRCALGAVLGQAGDWGEAERALQGGLEGSPAHAGLHFNLAVALERRGADADALKHYDAALASAPGHAQALLNRGALHLRSLRCDDALADFDAILGRDPGSVDALLNRNRALLLQHRDDEALQAARAALRLAPQRQDARLAAALALASMGHLQAATDTLQGSDPSWNALAIYVGRALQRQDVCDWHDRERLVTTVREILQKPEGIAGLVEAGLYMRMLALPFTGDELRIAANAVAAAIKPPPASVPLVAKRHARIRIGLFAEGVGRHPETFLLRRVASDLDRSRFEVRLYALNRDDGTHYRRDFAARADAFADLSDLESGAIVDYARREELDIALDAAGYFRPGRPEIFKARIAPIQVAYLATPGPHGEGLVDYRLSDAWTTPADVQTMWPEKLVLLPAPHWTFDNSIVRGPAGSRADHGLPPQGFVFCCITQAWKLEPESFAIWMRLLRAVEGSVLWLLESGPANARLRAAAAAHGTDPRRLVFAPRVELEAHIGRLSHAGLFLDTFYFNAQTTAIDALWAGVPLVTRTRATMASRLASTFVRSAGLDALVTDSSEAYEALALQLALDPERLRKHRDALAVAHRAAPLFDTKARVGAFERAMLAMVEHHAAGRTPQTLTIA